MATIEVNWTSLRDFSIDRNIPLNWVDVNGNYFIRALDNGLTLATSISQHDENDSDLRDFEDNFKEISNKVLSITHALESTITDISSSTTTVTLLPSNRNRKGFIFFNNSNFMAYVSYSDSASLTNFTFIMEPRSLYETPGVIFKGQITCVWEGVGGSMKVTEIQ